MKLLNFTFSDDNIGVDYGGRYLDLHNDYDFVRYARVVDAVHLHWRKRNGAWMADDLPGALTIAVAGVTYFEPRGALSDCLEEFGFFENDTLGKVDYNGTTRAASGHEVLVLRFVGGGEIAMQGRSASAVTNDE